jgi:hypothetical protein
MFLLQGKGVDTRGIYDTWRSILSSCSSKDTQGFGFVRQELSLIAEDCVAMWVFVERCLNCIVIIVVIIGLNCIVIVNQAARQIHHDPMTWFTCGLFLVGFFDPTFFGRRCRV